MGKLGGKKLLGVFCGAKKAPAKLLAGAWYVD
jgi:hypothetical protein